MTDTTASLISLVVLIFSAIVHEVMHGVVAGWFGDDTAEQAGRITLNPIPHIDLMGTIVVPFLLLVSGSPVIFGAAKPVPINIGYMRHQRWGMAMTSLAGPLSNFILAFLFILPLKFGAGEFISVDLLAKAVFINLGLGVLNLLPIPPLDGSKIVLSILPKNWWYIVGRYEQFGFILVFLFILSGALDRIYVPVVNGFLHILGLI